MRLSVPLRIILAETDGDEKSKILMHVGKGRSISVGLLPNNG